MKLKYAMTMQRKLNNTIAFGPDAQNEDFETGKGKGLIGIGGALKVAKDKKDSQKILKKRTYTAGFGGSIIGADGV